MQQPRGGIDEALRCAQLYARFEVAETGHLRHATRTAAAVIRYIAVVTRTPATARTSSIIWPLVSPTSTLVVRGRLDARATVLDEEEQQLRCPE